MEKTAKQITSIYSSYKPSSPTVTPDFTLKLPYLHQEKPLHSYHKAHSTSKTSRQFDLHTNLYKMPAYEPSKDRNLVYFLEKHNNRKIITRIQEQENKKKNSKKNKNKRSSQYRQKNMSMRKSVQEISKDQFQEYLRQKRAQMGSSHK